ncbi:MAG: YdcF family protein [Lachnospiraceae bacterium]
MKRIVRIRNIITILILSFIIYIICNVISICRYGSVYENESCDVAIVLGAATSGSDVSEVYKQRLNHAIELYQNDYVKYIIVTGGKGKGNRISDAAIARKYLVSMGISDEVILEEETSTITQENLENAKIIMEEHEYKTAAIVSDPLHMKRAMLLAHDSGIDAISSPTKSSAYKTLKTKIPFVARETFFYIGYKWYRLFR